MKGISANQYWVYVKNRTAEKDGGKKAVPSTQEVNVWSENAAESTRSWTNTNSTNSYFLSMQPVSTNIHLSSCRKRSSPAESTARVQSCQQDQAQVNVSIIAGSQPPSTQPKICGDYTKDDELKPHLQTLTGEVLTNTTHFSDEARLDVSVRGVWQRRKRVFFRCQGKEPFRKEPAKPETLLKNGCLE